MPSTLGKCLFLLGVLCFVPLDCEIYQDRPKIKISGGNLILEPAFDKNIYLRPNGPKSSIFLGDFNILHPNLPSEGTQSQPPSNENTDKNIHGILERLERLENKDSALPNDLLFNISMLWRKVNNIHRKVLNLQNQLNNRGKDECESHPCEHGGTCLNLVNGYHCLCPSNWEGRDCDVDVNECRNFAGTDLGCQNGATCINRPGSYECLCKSGWFGLHCTRKAKDCSGGDFEMCGHGTCVQVTSGEGVQCICHQGWTTNGTGVACLTDINECESYQGPRCSVNPQVDCVNLPGSFRCGQCPAGYEGDGYSCHDIDECTTTLNGGCSPLVTCHNTIGSRICGSCPPGYQGDGVTCSWRGTCNIGHGGCHPSAKCIESASPTGQSAQCVCPDGMEGDGVGISGCYVATGGGNFTDGCEINPCGIHGQCHSLRIGYTCICFKGYGGAHCEMATDACRVNPCHNAGICRADDSAIGDFRCECAAQYSGTLCQCAPPRAATTRAHATSRSAAHPVRDSDPAARFAAPQARTYAQTASPASPDARSPPFAPTRAARSDIHAARIIRANCFAHRVSRGPQLAGGLSGSDRTRRFPRPAFAKGHRAARDPFRTRLTCSSTRLSV